MNNRRCPICDTLEQKIIEHIQMIVPKDFLLPVNYDLVSCINCGFVYSDVQQRELYESYYGNYKQNTKFTVPSDSNYYVNKEKREKRYLQTVDFIENNAQLTNKSDILDVGCSYGATLFALKEKGYDNLYGIDLDIDSISYLKSNGIEGRIGSIFSDDLLNFNKRFDLIILGHILEHLHEPRKAIENISKWLKPNGKIMIECPDLYQYPQRSPFPGFFAEYEHINHFSIIALMNLMSDFNLIAYKSDTIYALIEDYPCIYTLFKKTKQKSNLFTTINDETCMKRSLTELNEQGQIVFENIDRINDSPIALWGAGQYLYLLLTHTPLNKCNIQYIVDKDSKKWGNLYFNRQIHNPQILKDFEGTIVICTTNSLKDVLHDIKGIGLTNRLVVPFKKGGVEDNET